MLEASFHLSKNYGFPYHMHLYFFCYAEALFEYFFLLLIKYHEKGPSITGLGPKEDNQACFVGYLGCYACDL